MAPPKTESPHTIDPATPEILSKRAIRWWMVAAVVVVLSFEIVKSIHHSIFLGPNKELDAWSTAFWGLDAIVAAIVTIVMVKVALSFDRLEGVLSHQSQVATNLSGAFVKTSKELDELRTKMQEVARAVVAGGGLLNRLNSEELWAVLKMNTDLQGAFLHNLDQLAGVWSELITSEGKNQYSLVKDQNFGLLCWAMSIDTYLKEEIDDIRNRTLATNIAVYIKLMSRLVDRVLSESAKWNLKVELLATAVLLPVEYYNWKEYKPDEDNPYLRLSGTSSAYMDQYRGKIKEWLKDQRLTLKRILLVADKAKIEEEFQLQLNDLAIQPLDQLRKQSKLGILCGTTDDEPVRFRVDEIGKWAELDKGFPEFHRDEFAYAIMRDFQNTADYKNAHVREVNLLEAFKKQLHSEPHSENALCLVFNDDDYASKLEYLPTMLGGSDGTKKIKCPDFLAIRIRDEGSSKLIACIATRLKPNYDTMTLRLITEESELAKIEKFIEFASLPSVSKPLDEVVK